MFDSVNTTKMISITKVPKILEGNNAACNGIVKMKSIKGIISESYYCNLYELEESK